MRFRPHRGGLRESVAEAFVVSSFADLVDHIRKSCPQVCNGLLTDIEIKPYGGDDDRIGWKDVHMLRWTCRSPNFVFIGFVEGDPRGGHE
jgi:hypothetical protein